MVTQSGYHKRTYEEILTAKIEKAKELFGADINTDSNTALGKYIRINAYDQYNVESAAEKIYYSIFPQTASGQSLDRLAWTIGISRKAATHSVYSVRIAGVVGATIKSGFAVGTEAGLNFHSYLDTVIPPEGFCDLLVECDEAGTVGNVDANDIVKIINPVSEVHEIYTETDESGKVTCFNEQITVAEDEESDYDFLKRYEIARDGKGSCNESSLRSALLNIPSVKDAFVNVDEESGTIECVIHGGDNAQQEIANAIFEKKPIGVATIGNEEVSVSYGALTDYVVSFSYVEKVGARLKIEITTDNTFDEENGRKTIKANIANFIQNLGVGKTLILTRLYQCVYSVTGVTSAEITAFDGAAGEYNTNDIEVDSYSTCYMSGLLINGEGV